MSDVYSKWLKGSFKGKDPLKVDNYIDDIKDNQRRIHFNCALIVLCVAAAVAAVVIGVLGYNAASAANSAATIKAAGVLPASPYSVYLDSPSLPLAMILPNTLGDRVGKVYRVWSSSAQPHTIQINAGNEDPTFDGTSTLATFGGAIGDGFVYEVIAPNRIALIAVNNVVFS